MKTTVEALQLRNRMIEVYENCIKTTEKEELEALMTMLVAGAGPTGVELSGTLAEMKSPVLPMDYPELDFCKMRIILLEGSDRTLASMSKKSSIQSRQYLEIPGVEVRTNTMAKDYDGKKSSLQMGPPYRVRQ